MMLFMVQHCSTMALRSLLLFTAAAIHHCSDAAVCGPALALLPLLLSMAHYYSTIALLPLLLFVAQH